MVTTVYVDDYLTKHHFCLIFGKAEMKKVDDQWSHPDILLLGLSHTRFFEGCATWADLRPVHFKFLIMRNLVVLEELNEVQRADTDHPSVQSLNFLIGGMIRSLSECADTNVETLKIQRIGPDTVNFDFRGNLMLELGDVYQGHNLTVVVDNTKD